MTQSQTQRLQVPGAPAAAGGIALCDPNIGSRERQLVAECIDSGWIAYGAFVERFEEELASRLGVRHTVAVASGTAALHLALLLAGVERDDEVVTSTLSFVAPANAIRYVGAVPVFLDAESEFLQIDTNELRLFLEGSCERTSRGLVNRETGRRVSAVLPVHILGHPVDLDDVRTVCGEYGLPVVEDAAEGLGAELRGHPVGALGDLSCLSFNGNKIITTGGGGMLATDDGELAARARYLSSQAKDDPLEYIHGAVGFNYRMSNVHAALGCAQLERLDDFVAAKRRIADRYAAELGDLRGVRFPRQAEWAFSTYWMYTIQIASSEFGQDRRALMHQLLALGIQTRPLWQPLHRSPAHLDAVAAGCDNAERVWEEALSLPCSTALTDEEQTRVIGAIREASAKS